MKHNRATNSAKKITRYLAGIAAATLLITGITIPLTAAPAAANQANCTARLEWGRNGAGTLAFTQNGGNACRTVFVRANFRLPNGSTFVGSEVSHATRAQTSNNSLQITSSQHRGTW
jgi:hypothetical protein